MCYPKPGPRCYNHALKDYTRIAYEGDPVKTAQALGDLERTATVITLLRNSGQLERANRAEQERNVQLELLKAEQERTPRFGEMKKIKQATDPFTSAEELDRLSTDESLSVRIGVATNPNTSPETLARLALDPTEDDEPNLELIHHVLKNHNTPSETLGRFSTLGVNRFTGRPLAFENPNFNEASINIALDQAGTSDYTYARLAGHEANTSKTLDRIYAQLSADPGPSGRGLSALGRSEAIAELAKHPRLSQATRADILEKYSTQRNIISSLASNPSLTSSEIDHLVARHEAGTHRGVKLANSDNGERLGLLSNPSVSPETIARLTADVKDNDGSFLGYSAHEVKALAANPHVDKGILRAIGRGNRNANRALASNPVWTPDELREMSQNPRAFDQDGSFKDTEMAAGLMSNPKTPADVIDTLAQSQTYEVRGHVATSPYITTSAARTLLNADLQETGVSNGVLRNVFTPPEVLEEASQLPGHSVTAVEYLAGNSATPRPVLKRMFKEIAASPRPRAYRDLAEVLENNPSFPRYWGVTLSQLTKSR